MDVKDFFSDIYGDTEGLIEVATDDFQTNRWFQWPRQKEFLNKYVNLRKSENVWFSVNLYKERERVAGNATYGHVVYMDADTCHPDNFRVPPSIIVESSPGKWQCYWILDRATPVQEIQHVAHQIAIAHEKQGCDKSGWIPTKMLRVPTTSNLKYDIPYRVKQTGGNEEVYTLDTIAAAYADIPLTQEVVERSLALPAYLPKAITVIEKIPTDIDHLYYDPVPNGGSWSERMWAFMLGCYQAGFTREEVFVVALRAKCNKYDPSNVGKLTQTGVPIPRRSDPEGTLWNEVLKAEEAFNEGEQAALIAQTPEEDEDGLRKATKEAKFLTNEEREYLRDLGPTFIDRYCSWVSRKTDSAYVYQRTLAIQLLSSIFGKIAYITPQFGNMDLNIWALIIGDTTYSRKSTARSLYLKLLHRIEQHLGHKIDIGSDFTAEGLNSALAQRDGLTSMVHRDEIHGFFNEMFTKGYMAGAVERLTELYDGKVQVTMRATKGASQDKRVHTVLNVMGLGTPEGIGEVLDERHFRSGFLARFVWANAEPPRIITKEMVEIKEASVTHDSITGDGELDDLVNELIEAYEALGHDTSGRFAVQCGPDSPALKRFNEWRFLVTGITDSDFISDDKSVKPSVERMGWTVFKTAALLALIDGGKTIELKHMLLAIEQAEYWYVSLLEMAALVSSSDHAKKVQEVEAFIATGKNLTRTKAAVFRNFDSYRTAEVNEWIDSLVSQGRVSATRTHVTLVTDGNS